ncbi:MAG: cysteine desulfurase [Phycisphaerae bacterium]|nr:cysteine desulfurase [Phycisphaerae bacterium]
MIYLDYNASTPLDPQVRDAMLPWLGEHYGNPSSAHAAGRPLRRAVDDARRQLAAMLGAEPDEIVFTSGGTEANNHVIKGVAHALRDRGKHIIISAVEHPAVSNPCHYLEQLGYEITVVPVDAHGLVDPQTIAGEVRGTTILISVMHANNEVGTIQNIAEIAAIAREGEVLMHTDAAQSCGKIPTDVSELGVDFLSVAGHKLYAPPGIGALYIRRGIQIEPLHHGAGHEGGRRAGTEPVANIVALGTAADLAIDRLDEADRLRSLRDNLFDLLRAALGDDVVLLGHPEHRLPNTLAVGFRDCYGADVLARCPELCASTGAACHAGAQSHSDVLTAMNVPPDVSCGMVRLSVGSPTTDSEIEAAAQMLIAAVTQLHEGTRVKR